MLVIPAIDLYEGKVVRLLKGDYDQVTVYNEHPADQAREFAASGATLIHVVDLEGARAGKPINLDSIVSIVKATDCAIEVGGGIRTIDDARALMDSGVERIILGTSACEDEQVLRDLVAAHKEKIIIAVDVKDGFVATRGWLGSSGIDPDTFVKQLEEIGVAEIIYTDIARDGTMTGPNCAAYKHLLEVTDIPVIASGGVSTMDDLVALYELAPYGLKGVVTGKAIYEGVVSLAEAVERFS